MGGWRWFVHEKQYQADVSDSGTYRVIHYSVDLCGIAYDTWCKSFSKDLKRRGRVCTEIYYDRNRKPEA